MGKNFVPSAQSVNKKFECILVIQLKHLEFEKYWLALRGQSGDVPKIKGKVVQKATKHGSERFELRSGFSTQYGHQYEKVIIYFIHSKGLFYSN